MMIVAGRLKICAAWARAWAWLPEEWVMTPACVRVFGGGAPGRVDVPLRRCRRAWMAPRYLTLMARFGVRCG